MINIPSAHNHFMYPYWLKISNPSRHRFVITFNKLSISTSLARQASHQDVDPINPFPSPQGTQCNGYHYFIRRED
jgi:hypothetical protein